MPEAKESDSRSDSQRHGTSATAIISETFYGGGGTTTTGNNNNNGAQGGGPLTLPMASRKDVDFLVQELKENLKLSHGLKARSTALSHRASHRASPYPRVPNPSRQCDSAADLAATMSGLKKWNHRRRYPSTCMNGGSMLTGSASVGGGGGNKKLSNKNDSPDDPFEMLQELISDGSLIKEAVRRLQLGLTPKFSTNREFYDSDEDCRTPPAFPDLCCEVAGM
jgi:hypothetical protein